MAASKYNTFYNTVWEYYRAHGRHDLPWRLPDVDGTFDPYRIMVSEVMLQQTQVPRVIPKFEQFITTFPNTYALAHAPLGEVLAAWNGLGYNRRAKFLWQAAQRIEADFDGDFPHTPESLVRLPGIGPNTAGAILAYAFNQPTVFIETNIRSVFIHHFFKDEQAVSDAAIRQLASEILDYENPRAWYWALMDYGTHLKQTTGNAARASKTYAKQSRFAGSRRQVRGEIIRRLLEHPYTEHELLAHLADERAPHILAELVAEQLIRKTGRSYTLFDTQESVL